MVVCKHLCGAGMAFLSPVQSAAGRCKTRTGLSTACSVPRGSPCCPGRRQTHTWVRRSVAATSPCCVRLQTLGGAPSRATRVPAPPSVHGTACVSPERTAHPKVKSDAFLVGGTGNGRRLNSQITEGFASGALPRGRRPDRVSPPRSVCRPWLVSERSKHGKSFGGSLCASVGIWGGGAPSVIPRAPSPCVPDP